METEEGIKAKNSEVFFLLLSEEKLGFIPAWSTVTMQKYWQIPEMTELLFNCVWSQLNIKLHVDVSSYFRGAGRSRSL